MRKLTLTILLTLCLCATAMAQTKQPRNLIDEVCKDGKQVTNPLNADGDDGRDRREISRAQFVALAKAVEADSPSLLIQTPWESHMDAESILLKELYARLLSHLGHTSVSPPHLTDSTYAPAYKEAIAAVLDSHMKPRFQYAGIVNRITDTARKGRR